MNNKKEQEIEPSEELTSEERIKRLEESVSHLGGGLHTLFEQLGRLTHHNMGTTIAINASLNLLRDLAIEGGTDPESYDSRLQAEHKSLVDLANKQLEAKEVPEAEAEGEEGDELDDIKV